VGVRIPLWALRINSSEIHTKIFSI